MEIQKKNRDLLKSNHIYDETMEHDACGVGLVASTEGLKSTSFTVKAPLNRS